MHYTGTIDQTSNAGEKGKQFDTSRTRRNTFDFNIGGGQVIQGWDQGLIGLCVGAKVTLVIPPAMGYGAQGAGGDIPGGATLNFDVEVVSVEAAPPPPNIWKELDANEDNLLTPEEVEAFFKGKGNPVRVHCFPLENRPFPIGSSLRSVYGCFSGSLWRIFGLF